MEIFDNHQCRCTATSMRGERSCQLALAAVTGGVVHGVVKRAPFTCLWQVEQVVKKHEPFGRDHPLGDQTVSCTPSQFGFRGRPQAEQTQQHGADRVLSFAYAKVEYQAAMSDKACGLGETAHLLDQAGLANSSLAAHVDDLTAAATETRVKDTPELL